MIIWLLKVKLWHLRPLNTEVQRSLPNFRYLSLLKSDIKEPKSFWKFSCFFVLKGNSMDFEKNVLKTYGSKGGRTKSDKLPQVIWELDIRFRLDRNIIGLSFILDIQWVKLFSFKRQIFQVWLTYYKLLLKPQTNFLEQSAGAISSVCAYSETNRSSCTCSQSITVHF